MKSLLLTALEANRYRDRIDVATKKARVENGGSHTLPITTGPRMAKRKSGSKLPQAQHGSKSKPSQHDKRNRLARPNAERRRTTEAAMPLTGGIATLVGAMSGLLDSRIRFRLPIVVAGALLAGGRRTAASWFRRAGVKDDWDRFYELLQSVGKDATSLMLPLLMFIAGKLGPGKEGYWTLAIDDSPTKRYGRHVEAANIHHNPTPGPGDGNWLYGHNWVCLAIVLGHPVFGVIALPLLSHLYVRKVDIETLKARYEWGFRTKHELALDLCRQVIRTLRALGTQVKFVVVFDGAYAAKTLVRPLLAEGGFTRWSNWSAGTNRVTAWSTAATAPGTTRRVGHRTRIDVAESPAKCCVNHFSRICKPVLTTQKSATALSSSSHWRPNGRQTYKQSPKVQTLLRRIEFRPSPRPD